jgi:hypothetical protein
MKSILFVFDLFGCDSEYTYPFWKKSFNDELNNPTNKPIQKYASISEDVDIREKIVQLPCLLEEPHKYSTLKSEIFDDRWFKTISWLWESL